MEASLAREILALLYADDLVGIAFTAEGLQSDIIDPCAEYARRHRYRANVPKCGVMVCGPASVVQGLPARTFTWGQTEIPRVLQYKHLFSFFFFWRKKPYMSVNLANDSNTQQTDKGNL